MTELSPAQDIVFRLRRQALNAEQHGGTNPAVLINAAHFIESLYGAVQDHREYKQSERTAVVADHADLDLWKLLD